MSRRTRVGTSLMLVFAAFRAPAAETPAASAPELASLFAALERPTVTGQIPAPALLRVGRAEIQPASGEKLLVLTAQGRTCGLVLDGPGRLTCRVEDRFSVPVANRNLKRASGLEVARAGDALVVTATLKGAAVWGWDLELPSPPAAAPPAAALPGWLLDVLERKLGGNPARDVLLSAWNSDAGYRWATLRGAHDDFALDGHRCARSSSCGGTACRPPGATRTADASPPKRWSRSRPRAPGGTPRRSTSRPSTRI
jgi:hypothetical protein